MASRDPNRPNVLFILSDDQGAWALGAAGNDEIITPTLDQLAATGTRFSNFFCASPVCSPARASLLTGQIPSRHGVHDWLTAGHVGTEGTDFLSERRLVTDIFSAAGYRCGLSGKWHLGANDRPRSGFVHWLAHQRGGGPYYNAPVVRNGRLETAPDYLTDVLSADAAAFVDVEATRSEPFWLSLHYTAPHAPWKNNHPAEVVARYDDCAFTTCPQEPEHPWLRRGPDGKPWVRGDDVRADLQGYHAAITAMDSGISQVMNALRRNNLIENTLVVFTSDNGFSCGQHGIWGKGNGTYPQNMYDNSVKVPAIFSQPGRIRTGVVDDTLLSGYDMAATLLEWAGLDHTAIVDSPGQSFASLLAGADSRPRDRIVVFDEYGPVRMIRTRHWKYVHRYLAGHHELFNLDEDPDERVNLVNDGRYRSQTTDMRKQLDEWFRQYSDPDADGALLPVTGWGQRLRLAQPDQGSAFLPLPNRTAR